MFGNKKEHKKQTKIKKQQVDIDSSKILEIIIILKIYGNRKIVCKFTCLATNSLFNESGQPKMINIPYMLRTSNQSAIVISFPKMPFRVSATITMRL